MHRNPGLEEPKPIKRKLYADSSRQSVRETLGQWKTLAAERRSLGKEKIQGFQGFQGIPTRQSAVGTMEDLTKSRRPSAKTRASGNSRRSSTSNAARYSLRRQSLGPVIVTRYSPESEPRNSMNATQIEIGEGPKLCYHAPVRRSTKDSGHIKIEETRKNSRK